MLLKGKHLDRSPSIFRSKARIARRTIWTIARPNMGRHCYKYARGLMQFTLFYSIFKQNRIMSTNFNNTPDIKFRKCLKSESRQFPCRETDGQTDMTKLNVAFRNGFDRQRLSAYIKNMLYQQPVSTRQRGIYTWILQWNDQYILHIRNNSIQIQTTAYNFCFVSLPVFVMIRRYRISDIWTERMRYLLCEVATVLPHQNWAPSDWKKRWATRYCIDEVQANRRALALYVPCMVSDYINKPTRCSFCMYYSTIFVQIYIFRTAISFIIRSSWFTVHSCRYSKSWTPDDERNGRSKQVKLYKNCRIVHTQSAFCWFVYIIDRRA